MGQRCVFLTFFYLSLSLLSVEIVWNLLLQKLNRKLNVMATKWVWHSSTKQRQHSLSLLPHSNLISDGRERDRSRYQYNFLWWPFWTRSNSLLLPFCYSTATATTTTTATAATTTKCVRKHLESCYSYTKMQTWSLSKIITF